MLLYSVRKNNQTSTRSIYPQIQKKVSLFPFLPLKDAEPEEDEDEDEDEERLGCSASGISE